MLVFWSRVKYNTIVNKYQMDFDCGGADVSVRWSSS